MKNTRDIVVVIIAVLVIIGSGVGGYFLLFPPQKKAVQTTENNNKYLNPEVDSTTYSGIEKLSSYPKPNLDNIGKPDLFAKY
jgi:preprotein translocase subunit YajC